MPTTGGNDERTGSPRDSGDESEDEREILEESPCGRWQKRRVKVTQRDVPGIDVAYLAMDMEEGREVVWNEVQFSARRDFKAQEDKIQVVFDNLIQLEHPNIVKFYKYWTDTKSDREKPRVIFITEYMSSGSLKQFLKRIKKDKRNIQEKSWRRWCTQILSALRYVRCVESCSKHSRDHPPQIATDCMLVTKKKTSGHIKQMKSFNRKLENCMHFYINFVTKIFSPRTGHIKQMKFFKGQTK
nr:nuclear receptor-binding protein-like [Lytechinus pictus]